MKRVKCKINKDVEFKILFHFTLYILFFTLVSSCKKEETKTYKVTYEVVMVPNIKTEIEYNSDYYAATKKRKTITFNSDSTNQFTTRYWTAERYALEEEGYYIKVDYTNNSSNDSAFAVNVYVNDTLFTQNKYNKNVILQGQFKN